MVTRQPIDLLTETMDELCNSNGCFFYEARDVLEIYRHYVESGYSMITDERGKDIGSVFWDDSCHERLQTELDNDTIGNVDITDAKSRSRYIFSSNSYHDTYYDVHIFDGINQDSICAIEIKYNDDKDDKILPYSLKKDLFNEYLAGSEKESISRITIKTKKREEEKTHTFNFSSDMSSYKSKISELNDRPLQVIIKDETKSLIYCVPNSEYLYDILAEKHKLGKLVFGKISIDKFSNSPFYEGIISKYGLDKYDMVYEHAINALHKCLDIVVARIDNDSSELDEINDEIKKWVKKDGTKNQNPYGKYLSKLNDIINNLYNNTKVAKFLIRSKPITESEGLQQDGTESDNPQSDSTEPDNHKPDDLPDDPSYSWLKAYCPDPKDVTVSTTPTEI